MSTTGAGPPGAGNAAAGTDERERPADAAEQPADAAELGDAGAQLSTAPVEDGTARPGSFGGKRRPGLKGGLVWWTREVAGWFRWMWRQLTSMRVALILLFLLSLGAIPGSVIPQTNVDQVKVEDFHKKHEVLAPIYDKLQLFDVYTSVWFSAIYILLFVSLAGCIVPRTWQFVGQLRSRPPKAPKRLDRMPAYARWETDAEPEKVLGAARGLLRKRRFRVETGGDAVASEKGYLREAGNLIFHIALIVLLLAFAAGQLWKSDGGKLIVSGDGFSNTLTQYDDFKSGSLFDSADLDSFGFTMKDFNASYWESGPNKGTAKDYTADIDYWEGADGTSKKAKIQPNHPLKVGDTKVFLQGNGFAPVVSVRDGQGHIAYRGPVAFLPQDKNLTSSGVVKVTDYRDAKNRKDQLGFQGFFVPTFGGTGSGSMMSQSPAARNPVLFLTAYHGDLGLDYGAAQNVYQLDTKSLKQFKKKDGQPVAEKLQQGQTLKLPNGAGSLKFEGLKKWGQFQIVHQIGNGWALAGALAAIGGLAGSLFIQRRRVWVRAVPGPGGRTVVELAGLGRSESAKLPEELGALAADMQDDAPVADASTKDADDASTGGAAASAASAGSPESSEGAGT